MRSRCRKCGKIHEELPSLEFCSPFYYSRLADNSPDVAAELNNDLCIIRTASQVDHFIRAIITQKVTDHCDTLEYGVWVLLNEDSYTDYEGHYDDTDHEATYFGYISNQIPGYSDTLSVRVTVHAHKGVQRPEVIPHADQQQHPFVHDYYEGISKQEVEAKLKYIME